MNATLETDTHDETSILRAEARYRGLRYTAHGPRTTTVHGNPIALIRFGLWLHRAITD